MVKLKAVVKLKADGVVAIENWMVSCQNYHIRGSQVDQSQTSDQLQNNFCFAKIHSNSTSAASYSVQIQLRVLDVTMQLFLVGIKSKK